ncbi:phosphoserine aminotransferase [Pseudomonas mandelii JR-1]|uniref:Phosphoserine aminotransferase n=1 Tax=Pseudomonas mandelii JR-1 TaxID=1147786 RepID=A0A024E7C1_9PSED|nr:phosphoserine aminotransferase [Pseudomonas mandelii JR-1]
MAHLHDRQALAVPIKEFTLGALQDSFGKCRRTGTEVIGSLAHIQSRSDLVVITQ